jgi:DNA repair exonuclease SbcCD ATPase subunit
MDKINETYKLNCNKINMFMKKLITEIKSNYCIKIQIVENPIYQKIIKYIEYLKINIKYIENNKIINKLNKIENKINKLDFKLTKYNRIHNNYLYELGINNEQFKQYNIINANYNIYSKKHNIYNALKKATHINGIPSSIIHSHLLDIEQKVNNLISQFIDKKINVILDGTNIIVRILDPSNNIINILGGMEMFIINIAFKIALASVSILPKNKMLIIDEGVSVLDKQHIEQFDKIALFLNSNYNHVILISHIDSLKDFITHFIHIFKNKEKLSQINYI